MPVIMLSGVGVPLTSVTPAGSSLKLRLALRSWASQTTTSSAPAATQPARAASRSARMRSTSRA